MSHSARAPRRGFDEQLLESQLIRRGIRDEHVLDAFRRVPREQFVPASLANFAYADRALPIGEGQTISQPYIVARMLEALCLTGSEVVLEVGTGSGYVAALLSHLAREVYSVERVEVLAVQARARLRRLGYPVQVIHGDGTLGLPAHAPFDGIAVAASGQDIPLALTMQLAKNGRLVIPIHRSDRQWLVRVVWNGSAGFVEEELEEVRFVPLIAARG